MSTQPWTHIRITFGCTKGSSKTLLQTINGKLIFLFDTRYELRLLFFGLSFPNIAGDYDQTDCYPEFSRHVSSILFKLDNHFLIVEDYAPLFSEENLFLVEMFDETFNILHIYIL